MRLYGSIYARVNWRVVRDSARQANHRNVKIKRRVWLACAATRRIYAFIKIVHMHVLKETAMNIIKQTSLAAALALLLLGPAHADGLKPLQGEVIDLGDVSGVAYYTVERDGFRVVATLAKKDEDAVPVRVVAVLAPDQSLTLSTPHEAGAPADAVEIIRRADTLLVKETAVALAN
jgi:hypothetical protein